MEYPRFYLIGGATGRQGSKVIDALLSEPHKIPAEHIFAITRNASGKPSQRLVSLGVNLVVGDLSKPAKLLEQLDLDRIKATSVFLAQAHGPTELTDAKGFIDAVIGAQMPYFVYSSVDRGGKVLSATDPSDVKVFADKYEVEKHLIKSTQDTSTDYTILRPTWFADNANWGFPGQLCMAGWRNQMSGRKMQIMALRDLGRWAVEALVRADHFGLRNDALSVATAEVSYAEMNDIWIQETGSPVPTLSWLVASPMIWMANDLNKMFKWIARRDYGADLGWLHNKLEPTDLRSLARASNTA